MTESAGKNSFRGCLLLLVSIAAAVFVVAFLASRAQEQAHQARLQRDQERRLNAIEKVRGGDGHVNVMDMKLLAMLADDPRCVDAVTSIYFYADLSGPEADRIAEFPNLKSICFYSCSRADRLIHAAQEIEGIEFETTPVSDRALLSLAGYPALKRVRFDQVMGDEIIERLQEVMPDVEIEVTELTHIPINLEPIAEQ